MSRSPTSTAMRLGQGTEAEIGAQIEGATAEAGADVPAEVAEDAVMAAEVAAEAVADAVATAAEDIRAADLRRSKQS